MKKKKLIIGIVVLAIILGAVFAFQSTQTTLKGDNRGVSIEAVIVNKQSQKPFTIIAHETEDRWDVVDNVYPDSYLYFRTYLDNTDPGANSEYTIETITISNTGVAQILGPSGNGNGDLQNKWDTRIIQEGGEIVLPIGEQYPDSGYVDSEWLNLEQIQDQPTNLITFSIDVGGHYLDESGAEIPLSGVGGSVTLKIHEELCVDAEDGTPAHDPDDPETNTYCQELNSEPTGKFCRISAEGEAHLTDHAQFCNCPTGYLPIGSVCVEGVACTDSDGDNYYVEASGCDGEPGFLGHNDCDDTNVNIHPDILGPNCGCPSNPQSEICDDGFDNDCDGDNDCDDSDCVCVDSDGDGLYDQDDNCPNHPNNNGQGVCKTTQGQVGKVLCTSGGQCVSGVCITTQIDSWPPIAYGGPNGIGDACECEVDFNCDGNVDGTDQIMFDFPTMGPPFGEGCHAGNPCHGDVNCDGKVDGTDFIMWKGDYGRFTLNNPCPIRDPCDEWCDY